MKSRDITETNVGEELVEIMANGLLAYMDKENIEVSAMGFEKVVRTARESGLNGKISFLDVSAREKMLTLVQEHTGLSRLFTSSETSSEGKRRSRSIRERFQSFHLTPEDTTLTDEEKKVHLDRLREVVGDEAFVVLEAFRIGDCQRRLVWKRMQEIISSEKAID